MSKRLLRGDYKTGDYVLVEFDDTAEGDSKLTFTLKEQAPIAIELPVASEV